jgi:predicted nuclease of predicted toxin-antitoxin system
MKLLFDQNLSPRLPRILIDVYPESIHVREINCAKHGLISYCLNHSPD